MTFQQTHLWQRKLAAQPSDSAEETVSRESLRATLLRSRTMAGAVAEEVKVTYPSLTEHGLTHLDALWETASLVLGETYPVTPAEAFVLGMAFLLHDLGNGAAAYVSGVRDVTKSVEWRDSVATALRQQGGRPPTSREIDSAPAEVKQASLEAALRALHARHAEALPFAEWSSADGGSYRIVENEDIRSYFGRLIGLVAASHWWPIEELERRLQNELLTAPPWLPPSWMVDGLKVAAVLRIADAVHLDARRAPRFLAALRRPDGVAGRHWLFQSRLGRPQLHGDRLLFTSGQAFTRNESDAWWLCFETLKAVDAEIRGVNELLLETNRPNAQRSQLQCVGIVGVEDPIHLAKYVRTDGWTPVDVRVQVTDVPRLIERFGGAALYGDDPTIPLRELLQNAADAVRARRILDRKPDDWGEIIVRLGIDPHGRWIEVADEGVGMSLRVLTGVLMNFSKEFWNTDAASRELPGLASTSFVPSGRYGIGFYSVFMWGGRIQVASRRYQDGQSQARILEFGSGLIGRPTVRGPVPNDNFDSSGTRVRVWLDTRMAEKIPKTLDDLVKWIGMVAPTLDVTVSACAPEGQKVAVRANDWLHVTGAELLSRITGGEMTGESIAAQNLRVVTDSAGNALGRIAALEADFFKTSGIMTAGGLRVHALTGVSGVVMGDVTTADRREGVSRIPRASLKKWATEQGLLNHRAPGQHQLRVSAVIAACGGEIGSLKVVRHGRAFLSLSEIADLVRDLKEFAIVDDDRVPEEILEDQLPKTVLICGQRIALPLQRAARDFSEIYRTRYVNSPLIALIVQQAATAWGLPEKDVEGRSELHVSESHDYFDLDYSWIKRNEE